jgi:hypothetical protein
MDNFVPFFLISDWGLADEGVDTSAKESNHVILTLLSIF